ncbi:hypothetical protein JCM5296_002471 [Sporobolomyces johnsonii]
MADLPDDDEAIRQAEAHLAALKEQKRKKELAEEARRNSGPQVLVAASPSPRKKRSRDDTDPLPNRIGQPRFFDSTQCGPPAPLLFKPEGRIEMTSRPAKRESKFSSHESAIPAGNFIAQWQNAKSKAREDEARKARASTRSTGFGLDQTAQAKSTLMEPRKAAKGDMKVKAKVKDEPKDRKGKGREVDEPMPSSSRSTRSSVPAVPAMTRPQANPFVSSVKEEKPSRAAVDAANEPQQDEDDDLDIVDGPKKGKTRNKDGTVIEELEMGPIDFKPPKDDPGFERFEPNSGIHLRERLIPHVQVQALLSDRYHLTPSQIYSLARVDNRKQVHIDVDADFVVIGVLAWKDELRFLHSNPLAEPKKDPNPSSSSKAFGKAPRKGKDDDDDEAGDKDDLFRAPTKKQRRQRYVRFELVDLSTPQASGSGSGALSVMLVEADSVDQGIDEDGNEVPIYRGQSGGAYERFWKESPGAVVAIVNPSFLPYTQGKSHTLKPISADSMVVLGRAEHLTFCDALRKKDGKPCNNWVDARKSTKCDFHVHLAVSRAGVGRAETFSNTASLKNTAHINLKSLQKSFKSKPASSSASLHDHQSGAKVVEGHTTYVTSGSKHFSSAPGAAHGTGTSSLSRAAAYSLGLPTSRGSGGFIAGLREGPVVSEEKKKREREAEDRKKTKRELRELAGVDGGRSVGGEYLRVAQEREKERRERERERGKEGEGEGEKEKRKRRKNKAEEEEEDDDDAGTADEDRKERRKVFSSEAVRLIGFNPALRPGEIKKDEDEETVKHRLNLEGGGLQRSIKLTAPPGPKVRSGVVVDPATVAVAKKEKKRKRPVVHKEAENDDDDDDDDLVVEGGPTLERPKIALAPFKKKLSPPPAVAVASE